MADDASAPSEGPRVEAPALSERQRVEAPALSERQRVEAFDAVDVIRAKRDGGEVPEDAIRWMIDAYTRGYVADAQMSAFAMAVLLNGMTIFDIPYTQQNLIKSVILLIAIVIDSIVNPRDEQTAQQEQGDI